MILNNYKVKDLFSIIHLQAYNIINKIEYYDIKYLPLESERFIWYNRFVSI